MPENEYEVPEVPDVDESEATEGPWDWATDLDPDTVRETYENVTAMRRSADEKYRAAAEERQYAEQMMARAQQQPEPTSHQNSHAESDLYSSSTRPTSGPSKKSSRCGKRCSRCASTRPPRLGTRGLTGPSRTPKKS